MAVDRIEDADLLLNTGPNEPRDGRGLPRHTGSGAGAGLANDLRHPDLHVYVGQEVQVCAGSLAADYQPAAARSAITASPMPVCFKRRPRGLAAGRGCLMVGDNYRTDVRGAAPSAWAPCGWPRYRPRRPAHRCDVDLAKAADLLEATVFPTFGDGRLARAAGREGHFQRDVLLGGQALQGLAQGVGWPPRATPPRVSAISTR